MAIVRRDYYKRGAWNAICDLTGQKYKSTDMKMQWNGLWVGKDEWSPKQPQLEIRPRPDHPGRYPVRNIEPKTVNLPALVATAEVYDADLNPYTVLNSVADANGIVSFVELYVLDADGNRFQIFDYDWADLPAPNNTYYIPPPLNQAQML